MEAKTKSPKDGGLSSHADAAGACVGDIIHGNYSVGTTGAATSDDLAPSIRALVQSPLLA